MELTPAHVQSVASFYDMYHLEPVGKHMVEVCTNLSCALVGAQAVVDAFAEELGVRPGGTTETGSRPWSRTATARPWPRTTAGCSG